jgi:hypothetical protein
LKKSGEIAEYDTTTKTLPVVPNVVVPGECAALLTDLGRRQDAALRFTVLTGALGFQISAVSASQSSFHKILSPANRQAVLLADVSKCSEKPARPTKNHRLHAYAASLVDLSLLGITLDPGYRVESTLLV